MTSKNYNKIKKSVLYVSMFYISDDEWEKTSRSIEFKGMIAVLLLKKKKINKKKNYTVTEHVPKYILRYKLYTYTYICAYIKVIIIIIKREYKVIK